MAGGGLQIIGAGYGRTGTTSLKVALEHLGFPCYHMEEVPANRDKGHIEFWTSKYDGTPTTQSYDDIFDGYTATVDFPGCTFYAELMEAYPDAKVLLSVRDSEGWWKSFEALMKTSRMTRYFYIVPPLRKFYFLTEALRAAVFGGPEDKDSYIATYEKHNAAVQATVPPEKLLVFSVKEGWEPLCAWLGVPVPDEPFPHANAGMDEVKSKIRGAAIGFFLQPFGYEPKNYPGTKR